MTANIVFPVFNTGLAATGFLAVGLGGVATVVAVAKRAENRARDAYGDGGRGCQVKRVVHNHSLCYDACRRHPSRAARIWQDGAKGGCEKRRCYMGSMSKNDIEAVLDRVRTWPPERQADLAQVATMMEEQDKSTYRLTDEQLAEVRRRRAKKNPNYVSLAEARRRFGV
jgi:hypothetical protein